MAGGRAEEAGGAGRSREEEARRANTDRSNTQGTATDARDTGESTTPGFRSFRCAVRPFPSMPRGAGREKQGGGKRAAGLCPEMPLSRRSATATLHTDTQQVHSNSPVKQRGCTRVRPHVASVGRRGERKAPPIVAVGRCASTPPPPPLSRSFKRPSFVLHQPPAFS